MLLSTGGSAGGVLGGPADALTVLAQSEVPNPWISVDYVRDNAEVLLAATRQHVTLTLVSVLLGLVLAVAGFVVGIEEARGRTMFIAGIVLGMLGGLETSVRDHFAGYRSHTTLLSGAVAIATIVVITLVLRLIAPGVPIVAMFAVGAVVFAAAFPLLRRTFQRRSGGLSFR